MFTASFNLDAMKQAAKGASGTCAAEGCQQPVAQGTEYCAEHAKQRAAQGQRKTRKARR